MTRPCPHCGADLDGAIIPDHFYVTVDKPDVPEHYMREIAVEVRGTYDGVLYWLCPDCEGCWPRFPEGHPRHTEALEHIAKAQKVMFRS